MSIRERFDPRRRRANGVDTHDVARVPERRQPDGNRARDPRGRRARARARGRRVGARSADDRARAHPAGHGRRRRPRSLAQHRRRRLRDDPADAPAPRRRGGLDRPRRLLRRAVRAASAGHAGRGAPAVPPTARRAALGAGAEPVDADVPRRDADLRRARSRQVDARARRGGRGIDPARERPRDRAGRRSVARAHDRRGSTAPGSGFASSPLAAVERRAEPLRGAARGRRDRRIRTAVARRRGTGRGVRPGSRSRRRCSCSARSHFSSWPRTSGLPVVSRFRALVTRTEARRDPSRARRAARARCRGDALPGRRARARPPRARHRAEPGRSRARRRPVPHLAGAPRALARLHDRPVRSGGLAPRHRGRRGASTGRALGAARAPRRPHGLGVRPRDRPAAQRRAGATRRDRRRAMRTRRRSRARPGCSA